MEILVSNIVQPGIVHLVLPKKAAAARACRKLLAMPNSPERVADLIDKLSRIMFQDEENKFTRYEWILLILEKIFQNEPFSEDLEVFLDQAQDVVDGKDTSAVKNQNIDGVDFRDEDFSDLGIPDFDELFDKAENQFSDMKENLKNLKDLCAEFLIAVEVLLDLNSTKRDQLEDMIDVNGESMSFTKFTDSILNGDLLEKFSFDQLMSMMFALPPGVIEKLLKKLDDMFFQTMLKRKFYNLSLKRYLGRISYYKSSEADNDYLKAKLEDYQTSATQAHEKINLIETETTQILDIKAAVDEHLGAEVDVKAQAEVAAKTPEEQRLDAAVKELPAVEQPSVVEPQEQTFRSTTPAEPEKPVKSKEDDRAPKIDD
jgi:hypothetical protein